MKSLPPLAIAPTLKIDDRYLLRPFERHESIAYFDLLHHPKIKPSIPNSCLPKSPYQAESIIKRQNNLASSGKGIYWAIVDQTHDRLIGACGFDQWIPIHNRMELSYELHPDYWQQGIAAKAVQTAIHFVFKELKVHRIDAYTLTDNRPSQRLLIGLGFKHEGRLQQFRYFNGCYRDVDLYALIVQNFSIQTWVGQLISRWS